MTKQIRKTFARMQIIHYSHATLLRENYNSSSTGVNLNFDWSRYN